MTASSVLPNYDRWEQLAHEIWRHSYYNLKLGESLAMSKWAQVQSHNPPPASLSCVHAHESIKT